jgi:hypothetical protein
MYKQTMNYKPAMRTRLARIVLPVATIATLVTGCGQKQTKQEVPDLPRSIGIQYGMTIDGQCQLDLIDSDSTKGFDLIKAGGPPAIMVVAYGPNQEMYKQPGAHRMSARTLEYARKVQEDLQNLKLSVEQDSTATDYFLGI